VTRPATVAAPLTIILFGLAAVFTLTPWATPAIGLALGAALALTVGNPAPRLTGRIARWLLQTAVVGLGFGMPFGAVLAAGRMGVGYTVAGIAAVGPAIGARPEAMSVALGTVFLLNAVALYLFPPVGHLLHLSQQQFAIWAAVAIHDTSSVVGAAASYGPMALEQATVLKLARALWIVPLTVGAAVVARRSGGVTGARVPLPWFIGLFALAAIARSVLPASAAPALDGIAHAARIALVLTLFLIGATLTRSTLGRLGPRPFLQGVLLWAAVGGLSLLVAARWVEP